MKQLATTIPGVGEALDAVTLVSPQSSTFDRLLATLSLALSVVTGGTSPNYGAIAAVRGVENVMQPVVKGFGNIGGGATTAENALGQAQKWLGPSSKEIAPGVYRSADNTRQFRMTGSDLTDLKQGPHVHFEAIGADVRTIIESSHIRITNP